ncbi:MAG: mechanosensitive ion channel [Stagnimonas sp.]|nr:mechanosensitive ion channel [Stagnimonas sp.]
MLPVWVTANPTTSTLALVAFGTLCSLAVEYLTRTMDAGRFAWQRRVRRRIGVAEGKHIHELKWLTLSYQFVLWPFIAYLLLHVWGEHDLGERVSEVLTGTGFKIGRSHIVPSALLLGLIWFFLLITFTRYIKKKLEEDWLPLSQLDPGVRVSVATLFGYVTFILASMVGLTVAGLDLGKLAIVAGALSVGIGFGLQNIINNFVSGLILLFERPVRVGDYVKVGTTEGFVRHIRIRATEIETWDKTVIIVPNSELISNRVENLTYGNTYGRVLMNVLVDAGSDPLKVTSALQQVVRDSLRLIQADAVPGLGGPFVSLKDFGAGTLTFEIGGYISNIHDRGAVASELRYAILGRFSADGIALPSGKQQLELLERGLGSKAKEPAANN